MPINFTNTLTKTKQIFVPIEKNVVKIYTCGPTVYDYAHIGNFRTFIFEDILRRYLKFSGYKVIQVMNITDIDDKIIKHTIEKQTSLFQYTKKYSDAFMKDLDELRIEHSEYYPKATEHISEMVILIKRLMKKGYAYEKNGSIYYNISKFSSYGKLSKVDTSKKVLREKNDEYDKEQIRDFALWKAWDENDRDIFWETDLGKGRPGWHIECSAMSMKYLGDSFDIHAGGNDLIFPHHENEIAQSEADTEKTFVKYWLHCEHLIINNKKMSKSLNNYYTLRDLLNEKHDPVVIRFLLLSTNYRSQLNFTINGLNQAKESIKRIRDFYHRISNPPNDLNKNNEKAISNKIIEFEKVFVSCMDDDLNISGALASLFDFIKEMNIFMNNKEASNDNLKESKEVIKRINTIIDILETKVERDKMTDEIKNLNFDKMLEKRNNARKQKDWITADKIRNEIRKAGYDIEDTERGTRIIRIKNNLE